MLRSPHAHARITSVDTTAAKSRAGCCRCLRRRRRQGTAGCSLRLAVAQRQPEGRTVSGDRERHRPLRRRHRRRRRRRDAVSGVRRARSDRRRLRAAASCRRSGQGRDGRSHRSFTPTSPATKRFTGRSRAEIVDAAFKNADVVVKERIIQNRLIPNAMEPRATLATWSGASGELTLWNTTQNPHILRFLMSRRHRRAGRQASRDCAGGRRRIRQQDCRVSGRLPHGLLFDAV